MLATGLTGKGTRMREDHGAGRRLDGTEGVDGGDELEDDMDVEMALLALSEDVPGPTEEVDVSALSDEEKRALLHLLRRHLGIARGVGVGAPGSDKGTEQPE
jgi:hypothetical protein